MLTSAALVFLVNIVSSFLKGWVAPKFGKLGVQVLVFLAAVGAATYLKFSGDVPGLQAFVKETLVLFSSAVAFYEVILSRFDLFKK